MKVKSEREVAQSCPTLSDPMDCRLPGSSVHGIFQARVLEWVAIAFSKEKKKKQTTKTRGVTCFLNLPLSLSLPLPSPSERITVLLLRFFKNIVIYS